MKKTKALALAALLGAALVSGCATVNGIGQDISGGARTVQDWL